MQRVQIPIEADVDNLEIMSNLKTNEYVLSLLMHHYFGLRLGITEDQLGIAPDEALQETMEWAKERQLIQSATPTT